MRKLGAFAALVLSGITASCAQRAVPAANIAPSSTVPEAVSNVRPNTMGESRRGAVIREGAEKRLSARTRQVDAGAATEQRPKTRASGSHTSEAPHEPWHSPPSLAALPPPSEPAEPNLPAIASLPPPPEPALPSAPQALGSGLVDAAVPAPQRPAAPTLSSPPPAMEPAPAPEPAAPPVSAASPEAMMPPLPEPAEPSFPVAELLPPLPEPAEPSFPEQEASAADTPVLILFPELIENLSLSPRSHWLDVTETFSVPQSLQSGVFETDSEGRLPSLIRDPWPLPIGP
jgi:hypothetical protein